ncbi:MAG: addiction module protein [Verrucomicrobiales bacterium]|jgi:putative addiction module component (TIGR02574 family)|nr:addiction module protein [Verrucomicrobiales bacterium]HQW28445.1 addiction module protein [Verrucomicrobiales bacterium]
MKIMSEIAKDALELSPNQRLSLARFLLDVSDGETGFDPDANEAWEVEISQRIEKIRNGTAKSLPLEEVFADLDRRFPG